MRYTYQVMPDLSDEEYQALKADIAERGVLVPIETDEEGNILDGHHRLRACEELGVEHWPRLVRSGLSEEEKYTHARLLNLARRHLNQEQRRALIRDQLKATPEKSDRQIAGALGVSDKTVGSLRDELESIAEIPQCDRETSDGRTYPRNRKPKTAFIPENPNEVLESARIVRQERLEEDRARREALKAEALKIAPPQGKYRTIVIDPPWAMERIESDLDPKAYGFDYPTMEFYEITQVPVPEFAHDAGHLYVWTTQKYLRQAFDLVHHWGFNAIFTMVWHKNGGYQPMGLPQYNCEFVVFGRRGSLDFLETKQFFTCFTALRREHSRKPDEFYDLVRRVSPGPRIDVFSREPREGFDQYGNETQLFGN